MQSLLLQFIQTIDCRFSFIILGFSTNYESIPPKKKKKKEDFFFLLTVSQSRHALWEVEFGQQLLQDTGDDNGGLDLA